MEPSTLVWIKCGFIQGWISNFVTKSCIFYLSLKALYKYCINSFSISQEGSMQILTKDSVTVFVNAIMYYKVIYVKCDVLRKNIRLVELSDMPQR